MQRLLDVSCLAMNPGSVCFTGPRPAHLFSDNPYSLDRRPDYQRIVNGIKETVRPLCEQGCRLFFTGGAQGFDQLAFWAVHRMKQEYPDLRNVLVCPFDGQEKRWSRYGLFSQKEYQLVRNHADHILTCARLSSTQKSEAVEALHYRNQVMVAMSELVIAYADPDAETITGGTGHALAFAESLGRKTIRKQFGMEEGL